MIRPLDNSLKIIASDESEYDTFELYAQVKKGKYSIDIYFMNGYGNNLKF